ncbi:MAG: hypothetical protein ACRET1_08150 [Burkholderiales bacterium]
MVRMSHTAVLLAGGILSRRWTVRKVSAATVVLLTLCGTLWSVTTRAGRGSASFGVTVRVLPHCDETRHGGLSETPDGRMVCVYPKIRQRQVDQDLQSDAGHSLDFQENDTDGSHVIRTIEY